LKPKFGKIAAYPEEETKKNERKDKQNRFNEMLVFFMTTLPWVQ
jgi:hypothetical protein